MRRLMLPLSLLGLAFLGVGGPAGADVKAGDVRAVTARDGLTVRAEPRPLGKRVATVAHGVRLNVVEVRGSWAQVTGDGGLAGWVRAADLVEPGALTGAAAYAGAVASADVTAAGRQFDQKTERTYRTMDLKLDAAYPLVDQVEKGKPSDEDLLAFVRAGHLGGTDQSPEGYSGAKYAKLKLLETSGQPEPETAMGDLYVPPTRPMNDEDFVKRLGVAFSPEQEYWLGRAVAAAAIAEHGLDPDPAHQALVQRIGASLATLSDRVRGTYGGYHFAVLDADQPNGISGPGGFVLVTRGALELARNEDEVAGVIAHEMAHISHKHGEAVVRKTHEFQEAYKKLEEAVRTPTRGPGDCNICGDVARTLGASANGLVKTLDQQGYGKDFEFEADWDGSLYLCEVGYRVSAIAEYLEMLPSREGARWTTHPSSEERIDALRDLVFRHGCPFDSDLGAKTRLPRFEALNLGKRPLPEKK